MIRSALLPVVLLFACSCAKKDGDATPASTPRVAGCPDKSVNADGVGKPCASNADCAGQQAVTCFQPGGKGQPGYCSRACFGLRKDECGDGAHCVPRGTEPAVCAPDGDCAAAVTIAPPAEVRVTVPCAAGKVNDFGVGTPCESAAECGEFKVARTCPKALTPGAPNWCSMLCSADADCGDQAFCWRRLVEERGTKFWLGSCAPVACRQ